MHGCFKRAELRYCNKQKKLPIQRRRKTVDRTPLTPNKGQLLLFVQNFSVIKVLYL